MIRCSVGNEARGEADGVVTWELVEAWLAMKGFLGKECLGVAQAGMVVLRFLGSVEELVEVTEERFIGVPSSVTTRALLLPFFESFWRLWEERLAKSMLRAADILERGLSTTR